jgi:hypoxia up-regulated 1
MEVEITGVAEALGNLTERGAVDPVIKANISLSESGFVSIQDPIAFGDIKDESLLGWLLSVLLSNTALNCSWAGKLKDLFTTAASPAKETQVVDGQAEDDSQTSISSPDSLPFFGKMLLKELGTVELESNIKYTMLGPMPAEEKRAARERYVNHLGVTHCKTFILL